MYKEPIQQSNTPIGVDTVIAIKKVNLKVSQFNISHLQISFQKQIILAEKKFNLSKNTSKEKKEKESLADVLEKFGLHQESQQLFQELADNCLTSLKKAKYLRKITQSYNNQRDLVQAGIFAEKMLATIRQTPLLSLEEKTEYFNALVQSCMTFYFNFESEKVTECVLELRKLYSPKSNINQQIDFYYSVCLDFLLKYRWFHLPEEAISHCKYYCYLASQTNDVYTISKAKTVTGFVHLLREEIQESRVLFKEAIDVLAEKDYGFLLICYTYIAIGYRMQNNISMAELWTNLTIEKSSQSGNRLYLATSYANLAWVYAKRSHWLYAEDYSRKALDLYLTKSPLYYLAIFPLIDALVKRNAIEEAEQYLFLLLHPNSKVLPASLIDIMKENISHWLNDDIESAKELLQIIISEAKITSYY